MGIKPPTPASHDVRADGSALLHRALRGTASASTPIESSRRILEICVKELGGTAGAIYMLDLAIGRYSPIVSVPDGLGENRAVPAPVSASSSNRIVTPAEFTSGPSDGATGGPGIVALAIRGSSCIGAIRVDGVSPAELPEPLLDDLVASADLLVTIYEDAFAFQLLDALQDPLDFTQSDKEFFRKISSLITVSSGMEFVALRELDEGRLRCIALSGFGEVSDFASWDLDPVGRFPAFEQALKDGETVPVPNIDAPEHAELRAQRWCTDVKSFVAIPVMVGLNTFGVLSVGARCEFEYAPIELRGFESIANGVGVSISNFRSSHLLNHQVAEYTAAASAITSIEVARSARHEASNEIENSTQALHRLRQKAGKDCKDEVYGVEKHLHGVRIALREIQVATAPPEGNWTTVSITALWNQARTAVANRLQEAKVDVRNPDIDVKVLAREDWLRHVFLNLLLNSIDAFREASKRSVRKIELAIDRPSAKDNEYRLTYSDTAGGVIPQRLRPQPEGEEVAIHQLIFRGGVTSKKKGSGYGLWLVRKIIDDHYGSIDLTNYRKGVTFAVRLPTPEQAKSRMKEARL